MDYEKLKSEIPPEIMSLCAEIKTTNQQLHNARGRLAETQSACLELQASIANRREKSEAAFSGSKEKFDNFMGRLRSDVTELELREAARKELEGVFIPKLESALAAHETNLKILADIFYMDRLRLINNEIDHKAIEILKMGDAFMQDFQRIYSDLGLILIFNREELVPIRWWSAQEQQEQKIRVGLAGSKEPSREQVWENYHKTVDSEPAVPVGVVPESPASAEPLPSFEQLQQRQAGPSEPPMPDSTSVPVPAQPLSDDSVWGMDRETEEVPAIADNEGESDEPKGQREPV